MNLKNGIKKLREEVSPLDLNNYDSVNNRMRELNRLMQPYSEARDREIIRKIKAGDNSDTPYGEEYDKLNNEWKDLEKVRTNILNKKYDDIAQKLGRKTYNFSHDRDYVDNLKGDDRLYAMHEYGIKNPWLDINKVVLDDAEQHPEDYNGIYEFDNDKYEFGKGMGSVDYYKKDPTDAKQWNHVYTGTGYGSIEELMKRLNEQNFKR